MNYRTKRYKIEGNGTSWRVIETLENGRERILKRRTTAEQAKSTLRFYLRRERIFR